MPMPQHYTGGFVVTPDNAVLFTRPVRGLYVGGTGNLTVLTAEGDTLLISAVPVGTILPLSVKRVNATGTTATLIVALT